MENGHGYSLNPFDSDDSMEDTLEYCIMRAYTARRRTKKDADSPAQNSPTVQNGGSHPNGSSSPQTPGEATKGSKKTPKKKKKGWKRLFICIKPQTEDKEPGPKELLRTGCSIQTGSAPCLLDKEEEGDVADHVAGRLDAIVKEIPFTPQEIPPTTSEIETDSPEDEVERLIGLLLREAGDKLNEEELENADISAALFGEYSFFERLITTLLTRMGLVTAAPDALGPQASPKTQIAVTCEVTSRLSAVDTLPMSRMLNHGARYLQKYYSSWVKEQGGYEGAFHSDDDDDDVQ